MAAYPCKAPKHETKVLEPSECNRLVLLHLPQIKHIARRLQAKLPKHVELADLESAGVLGLFDAAVKFDPSKGVKFKTYAEVRIKGAILDSLRELDWAPRTLRRKSKELDNIHCQLEQRLGRRASEEEVCAEWGVTTESYHTLLSAFRGLKIISLPAPGSMEDGREIEPTTTVFSRSPTKTSSDLFHQSEIQGLLARAIGELPKRLRLIVSLYYFDELRFREIGQVLGVNESRVSQCHTEAIRRLRIKLRALNTAA